MFRALFRRPRTIRVPIEESGRRVQPVKISKSSADRPSNILMKFFVAYCVFRFLETTDIFGIDKKSKEAQDEIRRHKNIDASDRAADEDGQTKIQKLIEQRRKRSEEAKRRQNDGDEGKSLVQEESKSLTDAEQLERLRKVMERHQAAIAAEQAMTTTHTVPIWFRAKPLKLYTRNDQEYKDFVRLQSDAKKVEQLKEAVGQHVLERLQNVMHQRQLQHIQFEGTAAVVLDLVPQLHAPPTYEVPCLIIKPSGVVFGWRDLSPQLSSRFINVFRPTVAYNASKASASAFFKCTYAIIGAKAEKSLGIRLPGYSPHAHLHMQASTVSAKVVAQENAIPSNIPSTTRVPGLRQLMEAIYNTNSKQRHQDVLSHIPFSVAIHYAGLVFNRVQLRERAALQQQQARGLVQIRGTVVCLGETGKYKLEVLAFYLPSEDAFLGPPMIKNWYIVKDYAAIEQAAEKKRNGQAAAVSKSLGDGEPDVKNDAGETKTTEK